MARVLFANCVVYCLLWTSPALGCSCSSGHEALIKQSDLAFRGVEEDYWYDQFPDGNIHYLFKPEIIHKGDSAQHFEIVVSHQNWLSCGFELQTNISYPVYAYKSDGTYFSGPCGIRESSIQHPETDSQALMPVELNNKTNLMLMESLSLLALPMEKKKSLIAAGCSFITNAISGGECAKEGRDGPTICVGSLMMAFSAKDGSTGQQDFPYRWNQSLDTFALKEDDYHLLTEADCVKGISQ